MDAAPDFEALRAKRNTAVLEMHQKMADEWGVPLQSLRSSFNVEVEAPLTAPRKVKNGTD